MTKINNIYSYLKHSTETEIAIKPIYIRGCFEDIEFDANRAGYSVSKEIDEESERLHKFSEIYLFTKM